MNILEPSHGNFGIYSLQKLGATICLTEVGGWGLTFVHRKSAHMGKVTPTLIPQAADTQVLTEAEGESFL